MISLYSKTSFYFLRHAQTDYNVHNIYNDEHEVELNQVGVEQSLKIQKKMDSLSIATVCSSPMLRVQQTKKIVLKNKIVQDVVSDHFRECQSTLWRLFIASESRVLTHQEWELIQTFINQVEIGLQHAFLYEDPLLIIAHGGTYWALSHLLQLEGSRKIDNCVLVEIYTDPNGFWKIKFIT